MATGIELATAYVSITAETRGLVKEINAAFDEADRSSARASKKIGQNLSDGLGSTKGAAARAGADAAAEYERALKSSIRGEQIGRMIGEPISKGIGLAIKGGIGLAAAGATAAVGGLVASLTMGFTRLKNIDNARFKLEALGNSAGDVKKIMDSALKSVKGTAFGLDAAAGTAATAVAAGVNPGDDLSAYLTSVSDAAAIAQTSMEEMGSIFNKVQTNGKAMTDDLQMLADRGLPIFTWLKKQYGVTGDALQKMVEDGKVSAADFQRAIGENIGGSAQKMGQSFQGSIDNVKAAMGRLGASFLSPLLGNSSSELGGVTGALGGLTTKLDELDTWVQAHQETIKGFFAGMARAALGGTSDIIQATAEMVGAFGGAADFVGNILGGITRAHAALQRVAGDSAYADELDKQADAYFNWGSGAKEAEASLRALIPKVDGLKASVDAWQEKDTLSGSLGSWTTLGANASTAIDSITASLSKLSGQLATGGVGAALGNLGSVTATLGNGVNPFGSGGPGQLGQPAFPMPGGGGNGLVNGQQMSDYLDAQLGSGQGGPESWRGAVRATLSAYGPQFGIKNQKAWEDAIVRQIATESGGNVNAINNYDSNAQAGHPSQGLLQFIPSTFAANNITGGNFLDPMAQIAAVLPYVIKKYGMGPDGSPNQIGRGVGYASGGATHGPGGPKGDKIPAWLSNNEHVFTSADVNAMGGQASVYAFRNALHRKDGGAIFPLGHVDPQLDNSGRAVAPSDGGTHRDPSTDAKMPPLFGGFEPGLKRGEWFRPRGAAGNDEWFFPWWMPGGSGWEPMSPGKTNRRGINPLDMGFKDGGGVGANENPGIGDPMYQWLVARGIITRPGSGNFNPSMQLDTSNVSTSYPKYPYDYWRLTDKDLLDAVDQSKQEWASAAFGVKRQQQLGANKDPLWQWLSHGQSGFANGGAIKTYDSGGAWPSGTLGANTTGQDEWVLTPEQLDELRRQGIDPATVQHGQAPSGFQPGPTPDQLAQLQPQGGDGASLMGGSRTEGYIPAGAGSTAKAGESFLSGIYGMGAEVINGIIDQAASAASTAAGLAVAGGTMGAGAPAAPFAAGAAQAAIGMGTQAAKRGVEYGAQMLGILTDSVIEQLTPFGAPRILTTDPTGFMPQQAIMQAATTSLEKAFQPQQPQQPEGPQQPDQLAANATNHINDLQPAPDAAPQFNTTVNATVKDVNELDRTLADRRMLDTMQYRGRPGP